MSEQAGAGDRPKGEFTQVEFGGQGAEYFGIWIVNLLLSIATLGIYSAWAKVRTNRYFYGHTRVGGHPLRYLAQPVQILIGRLVGAALFGAYFAANILSPALGILLGALLMVASPYLICLSLAFSLRMTAWRNVRFAFHGRYLGALLAFVVYPFLTALTLFLAAPWALKKADEFLYSHIRYGDRPFACGIGAGTYFGAFYGAAVIALVATIALMPLAGALGGLFQGDQEGAANPMASGLVLAVLVLVSTLASAIYTAAVRNHLFGQTLVPGLADFESKVETLPLLRLLLGNLALLALTLGLALPWVRVRTARFYAEATQVRVGGSIDTVIAKMPEEVSAIGEEVSGIFDMDVGLT